MSFDEYAQSHLRRLLGVAWAISGDWDLAQDMVQDVMLKLQRHWERVSGLRDVDAYVNRMLINEYRSWWRKAKRTLPSGRAPGTGEYPDIASAISEGAELRGALAKLSRQQQIVLALRYYADLSDAEISAITGYAPGTVRSTSSRGLRRLRSLLSAQSHETSWKVERK